MITDQVTGHYQPQPKVTLAPPRAWMAVVVLSVSLLMIGLDNTILNVTLPTLQRDLSATSAQLQWIVDAYLLVFAGLLLTAGNLGDRWGRRRVLQAGLVVFGLGSALASLSDTPTQLIVSRGLMGVGAAMIMPSTLSIITNIFTGPRRAKAIAIWTAVAGLGIALGPVTGGWLLERFWWGSIFLVNVPIAALTMAAGAVLVPESRDPAAGPPDPIGVILSITGLLSLVYGVIEAPSRGWTDPVTLTAFAAAVLILGAFGWWELRTPHPMLQIRLFRNRRFSVASTAIALAFFALFGALFFLTQYLQLVLGYSALGAGARTVPVAAGLIVGAGISAPLTARAGTKLAVTLGMVLAAAGLGVLTQVTATSGYPPVLTALILAGTGIGIAMAPATDSVMGSLPLAKASVGSAMNDTARLIGGAFGVAVLGTVISQVYTDHVTGPTASLSAPAAGEARDSLQAALQVAAQVGDPAAASLVAAARAAFTDAVNAAAFVGTAVALAAAAVALTLLPGRPAGWSGEDAQP
ncbi:MFS transporter [Actinophytocola sp.]|uniref:MFS transporter n=1 Tax=Actinophytocola sp. TaxID=1872138 RepID=UPI002D7EBF41|nr:MFS transporter [Actinophytocola sp.]HET9137880.1 MFS transporter [Actinophytocola sp.]HEU5110511.1 MFS transporter [Micromonosporaceae bacterium]